MLPVIAAEFPYILPIMSATIVFGKDAEAVPVNRAPFPMNTPLRVSTFPDTEIKLPIRFPDMSVVEIGDKFDAPLMTDPLPSTMTFPKMS
ncbi:hypothetical protein MT325_m043L [Paramecium bursaria chlorella virus MT325]|uniref:Uncharacterized protein m043L n=1 Tax=Paramecium bursaria Chlorella virus MT325 TaxID=346932 RepID=A7ITC3_PBCVM|nr:hypothetical protein MT325_m043L [Paramecium bursaria chlorella virus MT325]